MPRLACLRQRLFQNRRRNALQFQVELQGGDAHARARDFEIHVAQSVFHAENVGEDGIAVAFGDQDPSQCPRPAR